jgi:GNAT superfamily N-acetyltransferase
MSITQATLEDAQTIAKIVSLSNEGVAKKFGVNKDNNPKHPSFYDESWVLSDFERGEEYFLYEVNGEAVGAYLNRLSVLPSCREQGIGRALTQHIFQHGKSKGVTEISIGIIAKHAKLKAWYSKLGFIENGLKEFSHLPFDVLFMKCQV